MNHLKTKLYIFFLAFSSLLFAGCSSYSSYSTETLPTSSFVNPFDYKPPVYFKLKNLYRGSDGEIHETPYPDEWFERMVKESVDETYSFDKYSFDQKIFLANLYKRGAPSYTFEISLTYSESIDTFSKVQRFKSILANLFPREVDIYYILETKIIDKKGKLVKRYVSDSSITVVRSIWHLFHERRHYLKTRDQIIKNILKDILEKIANDEIIDFEKYMAIS